MLVNAKIISAGLIFFILNFVSDNLGIFLSSQLFTLDYNEHFLCLSLLVLPVGVEFYDDLLKNKGIILKNTKEITEIYKWTHNESGKFYIDSAINLFRRFKDYFNKIYISNKKQVESVMF